MANVNNAFAALIGAESQLSSSKKKKNKEKQAMDQSVLAQSSTAPPAVYNGNVAPVQTSVDVSEATAILERAAREARTIGDKSRIWKEWAKQVMIPNIFPHAVLFDQFYLDCRASIVVARVSSTSLQMA